MVEGRTGSPLARARTLVLARCERRPASLAIVIAFSVVIISFTNLSPLAGGLPTPTTNVGIAVGLGDARTPSLAVDANGALHVVRSDDFSGERGIYYANSMDGSAWSSSSRVDTPGSAAFFPRIAVEREPVPLRGRLYVAYQVGVPPSVVVNFVFSDGGGVWSAPSRVDQAPSGTSSQYPSVAASAGRVYIAWSDNRNPAEYDVFLRASADGGASWGPEVRFTSSPLANLQARVEAKGNTVVLVWRQLQSTGETRIVGAWSDDVGATWRQSVVAEGSGGGDYYLDPDVFLDDLLVAHVAWVHGAPTGETHIEYAWSADGLVWTAPAVVDDMPVGAPARSPSIAELAGTLWVAWDDQRNANHDVFASWSTDGRTWGDGVRNGNDLRLDDTNRNAVGGDDNTDQVNPVLRTGGFGVYAVWEDYRSGTSWDVYSGTVDVSPIVITEMQDEPAAQTQVELYNFARTPFSLAGVTLSANGQTFDLSPLSSVPARGHVTIGRPGGADLQRNLDLGTEGALVQVLRGGEVLAAAGAGPFGIAPDPLSGESSSRYAGSLDYVQAWTRTAASTFHSRNLATPPNLAPPVVLNEVLFHGDTPGQRFVELAFHGPAAVDLTGYRLVSDTVYALPGALLGPLNPYGFVFEARSATWFQTMDPSSDNVYLYDPAGRLLDMVGWSTTHTAGRSVSRVASGVGGLRAFDDASAPLNGWAFDQVPTLSLLRLEADSTVMMDVGATAQFPLMVTNLQPDPEYVDVEAVGLLPWPLRLLWPNGTPIADSPGDPDGIPDLGPVPAGATVSFVCEVTIPLEGPVGDSNLITASVIAASVPIARASVDLTIQLYPHFAITRTITPSTVYVAGSPPPYNTTAQVTVSVTGAGFPIVTLVPQDVVFQIDESGSMNLNDRDNLRVAAVENYIDGMRVDDRGALIGFTSSAWNVNNRPLTPTDSPGKAALKTDADTLACSPGCAGGTSIDTALQLGNSILISQGNRSRPRVEILLTDGVCEPPCTNTNTLINQAVNNGLVIYTVGLGDGVDQAYLTNIANRTGGKFYLATSPQDLDAIYKEIGTRINRTAGVRLPNNLVSMIEDDVAPYLTVLPGTFVDPQTGLARNPSFMQQRADRTVLQWNVTRILINETWSVTYDVTSTRLGPQDVALHPDSRVAYLRWDGSQVFQTIPQEELTVLATPSPPYLTATNPQDRATDVPVDHLIQVVFSEAMDPGTVQWTIAPTIPLTSSWSMFQILSLSHPNLGACTWYTVEITAGQDAQGEALVPGPVPNPWTFRTVCPPLVNYTITRSPERGLVQIDGQWVPVPVHASWTPGDVHVIGALAFDPQGLSRLAFLSWDDGGAENHTVTVGATDQTITAAYALQHPARLDLIGLDPARTVAVTSVLFGTTVVDASAAAWSAWVDDGSSLSVDRVIPGLPGERYATQDVVMWLVTSPLTRTVRYYHQFTASVRLDGLDGHPVALTATGFGAAIGGPANAAWASWVDAGSTLSVPRELPMGARERYRTLDVVAWTVDAPLDVSVVYRHQFRPQVVLLGLDGGHTVNASWRLDGAGNGAVRIWGGPAAPMSPWVDAGATLAFDATSTGDPPRRAVDPTAFAVFSALDATIRYVRPGAPPELPLVPIPNYKPLLALVYAIWLLVAGAGFSTRILDRYVPPPANGDVRARRFAWRRLTLGQKFNELSIAEVEEKVHRDRRMTRLALMVPFAAAEGTIGILSLFTGLLRIPEAGSWLPLGFWLNTGLLVGGLVTGIAVWRQGYRMTEATLLRLAEARARALERAATSNGQPRTRP